MRQLASFRLMSRFKECRCNAVIVILELVLVSTMVLLTLNFLRTLANFVKTCKEKGKSKIDSNNDHGRTSTMAAAPSMFHHPVFSQPAVKTLKVFYTDKPRNQTTVNMSAAFWEELLPFNKPRLMLPSDGLWMPILGTGYGTDKGGFVYSAFMDTRIPQQPMVRVLGTIPSEISKLLCRVHYVRTAQLSEPLNITHMSGDSRASSLGEGSELVETLSIEPQEPLEINKYPHHTSVFINCPLQQALDRHNASDGLRKMPNSISIYAHDSCNGGLSPLSGNNLYVHPEPATEEKLHEAAVPSMAFCPKPVRNVFSDVIGLIEYLELTSLLAGPSAMVNFYGYSYTKEVECTLTRYYMNSSQHQDLIHVQWHNYDIPFGTKYAEVIDLESETAINDCFYRSRAAEARFIVTADMDEFFMPNTTSSFQGIGALGKLMQHLSTQHPSAAAFEFSRENFNMEFPDDESVISASPSDFSCQLKVIRKTTLHKNSGLYPKFVSDAFRVTGVRTHGIVGTTKPNGYHVVKVNKDMGMVHHYRGYAEMLPEVLEVFQKKKVEHAVVRSVHQYRSLLEKRVRYSLNRVASLCGLDVID